MIIQQEAGEGFNPNVCWGVGSNSGTTNAVGIYAAYGTYCSGTGTVSGLVGSPAQVLVITNFTLLGLAGNPTLTVPTVQTATKTDGTLNFTWNVQSGQGYQL
jgi:hypothetical protein